METAKVRFTPCRNGKSESETTAMEMVSVHTAHPAMGKPHVLLTFPGSKISVVFYLIVLCK